MSYNPIFDSFLSVNFRDNRFRDNHFRDKIRDIRFRDKKAFETPVSINSLSRIETSVFEVTGFFGITTHLKHIQSMYVSHKIAKRKYYQRFAGIWCANVVALKQLNCSIDLFTSLDSVNLCGRLFI